ncbi:MAG: CAP domain-containing protein [Dehalococcoidia bacterium]|nr:CAP domain-containing protein [Dehalococcoidia bacterium]
MNTKTVERSILRYTNRERRRQGLEPLKGHRALIKAARGHSRWMARHDNFSHTGCEGSQPWDRSQKAGYPSTGVSENIWQASGNNGPAWKSNFFWRSSRRLGQAAVISWMNSPGHRANLLDPRWKVIGIGVARNKKGNIYLTQNFGDADDTDFLIGKIVALITMAFVALMVVLIIISLIEEAKDRRFGS